MRRHLALLAAVAASLLATPDVWAQAPKKPNVIVILADDLGSADIGVYGGKDIPTPHIDSIGKNGVRFTQGYVSGPYCSPTRAGLLTGRYQQRFGHEFNEGGVNREKFGLPLSETTIAQRMKGLGYRTGAIGKWHLGFATQFRPMNRGFDEFYGTLANTPFFQPMLVDSRIGPDPKKVEDAAYYTTDAYGERAVDFIKRNKDHPFFLYLPFNACHVPNQAPEKYLERFAGIKDKDRRYYAAMMSAMDDAIGRVLATLRELNLEEDTLIVFLSDNGGPMTKMGANGSLNGLLRGQKGDVWEGGVRVPFLIQWKGRLPAGKLYTQPVIQLDIVPTVLAAAAFDVKVESKLDGVNLLPYLEGKNATRPHDTLYWRFGPQWAIRQGDWKLAQGFDYDAKEQGPVHQTKVTPPMLFDLTKDPGETKNLAAEHPERVTALRAAWETWNRELAEPGWLPIPVKKKK
jgi:arylsulfatase A-like enzyme